MFLWWNPYVCVSIEIWFIGLSPHFLKLICKHCYRGRYEQFHKNMNSNRYQRTLYQHILVQQKLCGKFQFKLTAACFNNSKKSFPTRTVWGALRFKNMRTNVPRNTPRRDLHLSCHWPWRERGHVLVLLQPFHTFKLWQACMFHSPLTPGAPGSHGRLRVPNTCTWRCSIPGRTRSPAERRRSGIINTGSSLLIHSWIESLNRRLSPSLEEELRWPSGDMRHDGSCRNMVAADGEAHSEVMKHRRVNTQTSLWRLYSYSFLPNTEHWSFKLSYQKTKLLFESFGCFFFFSGLLFFNFSAKGFFS